jgi:hypothetical protein
LAPGLVTVWIVDLSRDKPPRDVSDAIMNAI